MCIKHHTHYSVESVTERGTTSPSLFSMCGTGRRVVESWTEWGCLKASVVHRPTLLHQETPPNYKDVLFSRCLKMTCKMFYYSKRCFNFWKHLEHVQKVCKMFWNILNMFKTFVRCFKVSKYLLDVLKHLLDTQGPIKDVQSTMRCFDWKMF